MSIKKLTQEKINNLLILDKVARTSVMFMGGFFIGLFFGQPIALFLAIICGLFGFKTYK